MTTHNPMSLNDPSVIECPFPAYRTLRDRAPVVETAAGLYLVSRYEDVLRILKDTKTFSSRWSRDAFDMFGPSPVRDEIGEMLAGCPETPTLLDNDPPDQTAVRSLVARVFTPRKVKAMEPRIRVLVERLSEPWADRGRVEFGSEFAEPLPALVTGEALGTDPGMDERLKFWSDEIMSRGAGPQPPERQLEVARHIAEMNDYFLGLIHTRRRTPREDLMSLLAGARLDDGSALTDTQIVNIARTFLIGGNETTTFLLTSTLHRLATDPALASRIRAEPKLIPGLTEELLRLESPAQGMPRYPVRDVEIAGVTIPKGATVFVMFGSANHDDEVFADSDELDLDRDSQRSGRHLAFGFGAHFCLGAPLARAEMRIALETLLPRMGDIALDPTGRTVRNQSAMLRGLTHLDLVFQPI